LTNSPKHRPDAAPIRKTGVNTPHEIGHPTAMTVKTNLHTVYMVRLTISDGFDQRAEKSKGDAPKSCDSVTIVMGVMCVTSDAQWWIAKAKPPYSTAAATFGYVCERQATEQMQKMPASHSFVNATEQQRQQRPGKHLAPPHL